MLPQPKFDSSETIPEALAPVVVAIRDDGFAAPTPGMSPALALQARLERAGLVSCQDAPTEFVHRTDGAVVIIIVAAGFCWAVAAVAAAWLAFG